ncbi:amino acid ABC transporter permease [Nocardia crassostreae]|uniref:amino acid ABC transporter permease n=1 Tax=Nocardia crassostreae TaxID=53428 RepID=UPI00083467B4|nr:amino acid ABC transporter permease [Nocardia crassostreae]
MSQDESKSAASAATVVNTTEPEPIKAIPLRRPGRWIAAAIILIALGLFVYGAATNEAYHWDTYWKYLRDINIAKGALVTLELTVLAMAIGVVLGVLLAVMRLSPNPVLRSVAWAYLWVFRGTPVYVQLVFWGLFPSLYKTITVGVPFGPTLTTFDVQGWSAPFFFAVIGLGLNEAAYMAEIVRAGINSVGDGQREASTALGMSWAQTMSRTVLPQAMRVIIPPTGNELISMLKTTSLVTAIPLTIDLYGRARDIYGINFQPIPLLLVAATWYLAITSVLMVGQFYLERYYSRGMSRQLTAKQMRALAALRGGGDL